VDEKVGVGHPHGKWVSGIILVIAYETTADVQSKVDDDDDDDDDI